MTGELWQSIYRTLRFGERGSMITLIADEGIDGVGYELYEELSANGMTTEYISLEGVKVKPCINCGGCTYKTFGKCVVRDDADWILKKIIAADVLIIVCPITFGSYSYKMKQVLDKISLIMDRHYYIKDKEMVKGGMDGRQFKFFALGINNGCIDSEIEAFNKLHHENVVITRGSGSAYVVNLVLTKEKKAQIIREVQGA